MIYFLNKTVAAIRRVFGSNRSSRHRRSVQFTSNTPLLISTRSGPYLDSIAINGNNQPFELLESVHDYLPGDIHFDLKSLASIDASQTFLDKDTYRIPATSDREGYHGTRHFDWWLSGLTDYLKIGEILEQRGAPLASHSSVFELGCASGRVLRHFAIQRPDLHCWGADIKSRHIEWMRLFLPPRLKVFQNTVLPHLPIDDKLFSLAMAFSVFTHIDDLELAWLAELRRIVKPGGFLYVTIHSERTWNLMKPGVPIYDALIHMRKHISDYRVSPKFLGGPMPKERTIFRWHTANIYNCNVFHHTSYIKREWGRFFHVEDIIAGGSDYQDVVLLRRPL